MRLSVNTKWLDNMSFDSQVGNHTIRLDTTAPMGEDSGASPKGLVLAGLAGCTGMDVVSLLEKMRVDITDFEIAIDADLTEEHPRVFSEIRMIYKISGKSLDKVKIQKAIDLSQDKYCGVSAMLKKNSEINYSIEYLED